jgi:hypothetical protein
MDGELEHAAHAFSINAGPKIFIFYSLDVLVGNAFVITF